MSNLKKIGIILGGAVILAAIVALVFWLGSSGPGANGGVSGEGSVITQGVPAGLQVPSGTTIQLGTTQGTVTVNNFYKNVTASENEFLILGSATDYQISYDTSRSSFYIQLSSIDVRSKAEQALLAMLGVSNADACKLNVHEGWTGSPTAADVQPKLSLCK